MAQVMAAMAHQMYQCGRADDGCVDSVAKAESLNDYKMTAYVDS
jgi:hypothetical protein